MRAALLSAALLLAATPVFTTPAWATDVIIKDFVGTVSVIEGDVDVPMIANNSDDLAVSNRDDVITIDGNIEKPEETEVCRYGSGGFTMDVNGKTWFGKRKKADRAFKTYPNIEVSVPEGATLTIENSIVELTTEPLLSRADLRLMGCRDTSLGNVLEANIRKSGSSYLTMGQVGSLELRKSGAGDMEIDEIGTARLNLSGAGDLGIGRVGQSAAIKRSGAGDIEIDTVNGELSYQGSGAGGLDVESGTITRLMIDKSGAGDVEIDADIVDAQIKASGVGDIELGEVSGEYSERVSGRVEVRRG